MADEVEDPFMDPLSTINEVTENSSDDFPPGMPDELKEIINNIHKAGAKTETTALVYSIGPDGKPKLMNADGSEVTDMPDMVSKILEDVLADKTTEGPSADGFIQRGLDNVVKIVETSKGPGGMLKSLGWPHSEDDANEVFVDISKAMSVGVRKVFKKDAFLRLYKETDLIESMAFTAQLMFVIGYQLGKEGSGSDDSTGSTGAEHSPAEQTGDPGGA